MSFFFYISGGQYFFWKLRKVDKKLDNTFDTYVFDKLILVILLS